MRKEDIMMGKMIKSSEIKKGMKYKFENMYYDCTEVTYISGFFSRSIGRAKVIAKRITDGAIVEMTLSPNELVEEIYFNENKMIFTYEADEKLYFIDSDTYDMVEAPISMFKWEKNFLNANLEVSCLVSGTEMIKINLPDMVCLTINSCDKIDGSKPFKNAICETGLKVQVPLFTNAGDDIYVSTVDGTYKGRAN